MKKYVFFAIVMGICGIDGANAGQKFRHGSNNMCYYITNTGSKKAGNNWTYYYCGAQTAKCDGKKSKGHDKVVWQYHGDSFSYGGNKYWCCGGTHSQNGQYFPGAKWIVDTKTETKSVGGGTCDVKIETSICGDVQTVDCNTPGRCNSGYVMRNGTCVAVCPDGQGFESAASNNCIECETTSFQGIKYESSENKLCIKCDKDIEFFDRSRKACVKKSDFAYHIPATTMKKCWRCPDEETFTKCVKIVSRPIEELDFADPNESTILKRCYVDKSILQSVTKK